MGILLPDGAKWGIKRAFWRINYAAKALRLGKRHQDGRFWKAGCNLLI